MTINTGQIASLLKPGLAAILSRSPRYPTQWSEIFDVYDSEKAVEIDVEMKMLGLAQIRAEGAATAMDDMGQKIITQYTSKYVALGFIITRQAIMDNLYEKNWPLYAEALKDSLAQTKENIAANVLNNGFNPAFPIGDGQPVYSQNHTLDAGVYSNMEAVPSTLSETSLESAITAIQRYVNQAGLIVMTQPKKLIVPAKLQFTACRLLESSFRTGTANNDISAVYNLSAVPEGYRVNQFLTNPNAWFIMTDAPQGFKLYQRESMQSDTYADFATDNVMAKAIERYSVGVTNPRATFGNQGA